ncbi:MAG: hypothetical protein ACI8VT_003122, partial [Saprospiraceae bacterium]
MKKTDASKFILIPILCFMALGLNAQGFTDVSLSAGVSVTHDGTSDLFIGSGAAWFDYNNDGDLDLYVTMRTTANYLYRNDGGGTFTDVASSLAVQDAAGDGAGVVVADFNNDGYKDIYLANSSGDILFKNNNGTSFTDITVLAGLDVTGPSRGTSATWGDYDNDGFLDLYVSHHLPTDVSAPGATQQDYLFHNDGNETFTDVSDLFVTNDLLGYGFIGSWTDIDLDGDLDIVLVNDCPFFPPGEPGNYTGTKIFRNDSGTNGVNDWTFTEISATALPPSTCDHGMGLAIGDYDHDGDFDFFYTDIGEVNLYRNDGGTFTNVTTPAEVGGQPVNYFSWGSSFFDYNLDGWQDIIIAFGSYSSNSVTEPRANQLFENDGDGTFTDVASTMGMADIEKTRTCVFGDYDNDGDPDVYQVNYGEVCRLKRNDNNNGNNWLNVTLIGIDSNRDGIGSNIKLTDGDGVIQYFETRSGSNLGGGDAIDAYFGLGAAATITELEITWPSGIVQTLNNLTINQTEEVTEDVPLPIEMDVFNAQAHENEIFLDWRTLSEFENAYFNIQRSNNGRNFQNIGQVAGNGNTSSISSYQFIDKTPLPGDNYYRLEQTDYDGSTSISPIKQVRFSLEGQIKLLVVPNPVINKQFEVIFTTLDREVTLEIVDVFGKIIKKENLTTESAETRKTIFTPRLAAGMYF